VAGLNYYERHLGDYAKDAGHLSLLEHGAYTLLLDRYYSTESPIVKADAYRVCRAASRAERQAVDAVLAEFFTLVEDGWRHKRCDEEISKFRVKSEKAKRSAFARWDALQTKSERNANASPNAMRTHSEGNALQTPVTSNQTPRVDLPPSSPEPSVVASPTPARPRTRAPEPALAAIRVDDLCAPDVSREAIDEWRKHRDAIGKPLRPHELITFGKVLRAAGTPSQQLATVRNCVANGWSNLRHADTQGTAPVLQTWEPPDDEPEEQRRA
jgi:uncharacterized protein YdaU (DUF1376 family)